jgi:hypothetical protein
MAANMNVYILSEGLSNVEFGSLQQERKQQRISFHFTILMCVTVATLNKFIIVGSSG